jgi:hypothetical protein
MQHYHFPRQARDKTQAKVLFVPETFVALFRKGRRVCLFFVLWQGFTRTCVTSTPATRAPPSRPSCRTSPRSCSRRLRTGTILGRRGGGTMTSSGTTSMIRVSSYATAVLSCLFFSCLVLSVLCERCCVRGTAYTWLICLLVCIAEQRPRAASPPSRRRSPAPAPSTSAALRSARSRSTARTPATASAILTSRGKETPLCAPFTFKNHRFTKTGSGQTKGKLKTEWRFLRIDAAASA